MSVCDAVDAGSMLALAHLQPQLSLHNKNVVWNLVMVSPHLSTHNNAINGSLLPSLLYSTLYIVVEWFEAGHYSTCQSMPACAHRGNHNVFNPAIANIQRVDIYLFRKLY